MKTIKRVSRLEASVSDLVADYKSRGMDRQGAWNQFVKDRALKPEVDAKVVMAAFDMAVACPLDSVVELEFHPTHDDVMLGMACSITQAENGVYHIVWADGSTGSNPPSWPPSADRYVPLT